MNFPIIYSPGTVLLGLMLHLQLHGMSINMLIIIYQKTRTKTYHFKAANNWLQMSIMLSSPSSPATSAKMFPTASNISSPLSKSSDPLSRISDRNNYFWWIMLMVDYYHLLIAVKCILKSINFQNLRSGNNQC